MHPLQRNGAEEKPVGWGGLSPGISVKDKLCLYFNYLSFRLQVF